MTLKEKIKSFIEMGEDLYKEVDKLTSGKIKEIPVEVEKEVVKEVIKEVEVDSAPQLRKTMKAIVMRKKETLNFLDLFMSEREEMKKTYGTSRTTAVFDEFWESQINILRRDLQELEEALI